MSQTEPNRIDIITVLKNNRLNRRTKIVLASTVVLVSLLALTTNGIIAAVRNAANERTTCRFVDNDAREKLMYVVDGPCPSHAFIETWIRTSEVSSPFARHEEFWKAKQEQAAADQAKAIARYHRAIAEQEATIAEMEFDVWLKKQNELIREGK